jgi:hypothetical protein
LAKTISRDVWLLRLDGTDKARLVAARNLFRVDVRGAEHILSSLPRLLARSLTPEAARAMVQQLNAIGGVAHVCAAGETPDFATLSAEPAPPVPLSAIGRTRRSGEIAGEAARAVQDAATLRWPEANEHGEAYAWETDPSHGPPPPAPRAVRHSAVRVAALLAATLLVLAGGATAYWSRFGHDLTRVSAASWSTPDAGAIDALAVEADASVASDDADTHDAGTTGAGQTAVPVDIDGTEQPTPVRGM